MNNRLHELMILHWIDRKARKEYHTWSTWLLAHDHIFEAVTMTMLTNDQIAKILELSEVEAQRILNSKLWRALE